MKKNKQKSCLQPSPKSPRQYVYVMRFCSVKQVYDVLGTIFVYVYTKYNSLYTVRLSFIIHKHSRTWMQIPGNSQTITARSKTCHENHCCTHHHHLHHPPPPPPPPNGLKDRNIFNGLHEAKPIAVAPMYPRYTELSLPYHWSGGPIPCNYSQKSGYCQWFS